VLDLSGAAYPREYATDLGKYAANMSEYATDLGKYAANMSEYATDLGKYAADFLRTGNAEGVREGVRNFV